MEDSTWFHHVGRLHPHPPAPCQQSTGMRLSALQLLATAFCLSIWLVLKARANNDPHDFGQLHWNLHMVDRRNLHLTLFSRHMLFLCGRCWLFGGTLQDLATKTWKWQVTAWQAHSLWDPHLWSAQRGGLLTFSSLALLTFNMWCLKLGLGLRGHPWLHLPRAPTAPRLTWRPGLARNEIHQMLHPSGLMWFNVVESRVNPAVQLAIFQLMPEACSSIAT